jgi:hypothetical protein
MGGGRENQQRPQQQTTIPHRHDDHLLPLDASRGRKVTGAASGSFQGRTVGENSRVPTQVQLSLEPNEVMLEIQVEHE